MYDREFARMVLERARAVGAARAAAEHGVAERTIYRWASRGLPRGRWGLRGADREARRAMNDEERAAYDAAIEEARVLRAVLDALKGEASMSTRRRIGLAGEIARESGLPEASVLRALGVSRQLAHYHRARPDRDPDADIRARVRECWEAVRRRGYRAVWRELGRRGVRCSEKRVRRAMRQEGLACARRPRRRYSSYAGEAGEAPPNLPLMPDGTHRFRAAAPWALLVTDVTEFRLPSGDRVYLSPVVDCFDGCLASWSVGTRPDAWLANSSLLKALSNMPPGARPVVHTDRGCHYRWPWWRAICEAHGAARSMSRKSASPDNARAEGFFGTLKQEFFYPRDWEGVSAGEFMAELSDWLLWFNHGRAKESLGWLTYEEYRASLGYEVPFAA